MIFNIESEFVKKHIKKEYQERLIFELQSKKHREKALSRFSHNSQLILKNHFEKTTAIPTTRNLPFEIDFSEKCYIISSDENDGIFIPLIDAIKFCEQSYMAVILITSKVVIIKEEYENGKPFFFVAKA